MKSGIIMIYDDERVETSNRIKKSIKNFSDDHQRILNLLYDNKIVFEKDNSAIEDILDAFISIPGHFIRECHEIVKDVSIGYCIIPIRDYDIP